MELHPILEKDGVPNPGLWYVLSAVGECPSMRVGHTCSYVPGIHGYGGKVYVIGGANPSGTFGETFVLDLDTMSWDTCEHPGLRGRYEHTALVAGNQAAGNQAARRIYVYGGADQSGNHSDIQLWEADGGGVWSSVTPTGGNPPSARTYHGAVCSPDTLLVYSGGHTGADPVTDRQVHRFDVATHAWTTLRARGDAPKPRHGHLVAQVGNKVFIHGGMAGTTFYDDLHVLDLERNAWNCVKRKKVYPSARAAHGGVVLGTDLYVFGGMNRDGALDDLYRLDTERLVWSKVPLQGPPPTPRLDFAMCNIRLRVPACAPAASHPEQLLTAGGVAKDVIDAQLRLGSAGSQRSASSAGSTRGHGRPASPASPTGGGGGGAESDGGATVGPGGAAMAGDAEGPVASGDNNAETCAGAKLEEAEPASLVEGVREDGGGEGPMKLVDLALVLGGMDTEGELFDDCLVILLQEQADC